MVRRRKVPPTPPPPPSGFVAALMLTDHSKTVSRGKGHDERPKQEHVHLPKRRQHRGTPPTSPIRSPLVSPQLVTRTNLLTSVTPAGILRRQNVSSRSPHRHVTFARHDIVFRI